MNILSQEVILGLLNDYYLLFAICLFLGSFAATFYIMPKVLWVTKEKGLLADVNERSAHAVATPSFGGVSFFIVLVIMLSILQSLRVDFTGNHLLAALTILFMVGLKDDLVISSAKVKLFGQISASCFIIFSPELQLTNLYGFWRIFEIPESVGYIFKGFFIVALINAYNLIDGIDGLAAFIGIVVSGFFAIVFFLVREPYYVLVSISLFGIFAAFLPFNFSRGHRKIFMGDSGSMIMGLMLAFLSLKILVLAPSIPLMADGHNPANRLLLLACILFLPVLDTLRVMFIRIIRGRSPFSADRNHAHHVLLDLGFSHKKAGFSLAFTNILIIVTYKYISVLISHLWLTCYVLLIYMAAFLLLNRLKILGTKRALLTGAEFRKEENLKPAEGLRILAGVQNGFSQVPSKKTKVS